MDMKYLIPAVTILLVLVLTGCRSTGETAEPSLLFIDCRTQKIYPLDKGQLVNDDPLMPSIALPQEMPNGSPQNTDASSKDN